MAVPSYTHEDLGLPREYGSFTQGRRKRARKESLSRWFDTDRPNVLCIEVEDYLKAHRLWVEYYVKPENPNVYYDPDPEHKYKMLRNSMLPPINPEEPSKSAQHAPRGTGKTITITFERCSMIAVARPYSEIVVTQSNGQRTGEEIRRIAKLITSNRRIRADFGGAGSLFPKNRQNNDCWNRMRLDFLHNSSTIIGVSCGAAHRGRHPILWVPDDPEPDEESRNQEWRAKFMDWLFGAGLGMMRPGSHVDWTGTVEHPNSCLQMALRGIRERTTDLDKLVLAPDPRFDDWRREKIPMIYRDEESGELRSIWPSYMSVEGMIQKRKSLGKHIAAREFMGEIESEDDVVFIRDDARHGYMRCVGEGIGVEDYFFDLKTGRQCPWGEFVDSLAVFGGVDIADSTRSTADPGAAVFVGVSDDGTIYVLDALVRKQIAIQWVEDVFPLAMYWKCVKIGWEKVALSSIVVRMAKQRENQLLAEGKKPPRCVPIDNTSKTINKPRRIIGTLSPLMLDDRIRFLHFCDVKDSSGRKHAASGCASRRYHAEVKNQIDGYGESGASGHDDAVDALQMAIRTAGGVTGWTAEKPDHNEQIVKEFDDMGFTVNPAHIPFGCWTKKMWEEHELVGVAANDLLSEEMDPYAY